MEVCTPLCLLLVVHMYCFFLQDMQEKEAEELEQATNSIFITGKEDPFHPTRDIKIVIEGTEVLNELPLVATPFAMFFGLMLCTQPKVSEETAIHL